MKNLGKAKGRENIQKQQIQRERERPNLKVLWDSALTCRVTMNNVNVVDIELGEGLIQVNDDLASVQLLLVCASSRDGQHLSWHRGIPYAISSNRPNASTIAFIIVILQMRKMRPGSLSNVYEYMAVQLGFKSTFVQLCSLCPVLTQGSLLTGVHPIRHTHTAFPH